MNILIFGGTRFIGKDIVEKLIDENLSLTIFSRNPKVPRDINHIQGDRNNIKDIESIKGSFDIVIDFISYNDRHTSQILNLFPKSRYILISTAWKEIKHSLKQEAKYNYIKNKRLAEEEVIKSRKTNKNNTIIRLPVILGLNDHTSRTNFFRNKTNKYIYLTNPDTNIYFCWKSDVSEFIVNQILSKDKYYPPIIYPSIYFNIKLSNYIEMHQSFEKVKYLIKFIDRNQMLNNNVFENYINTIAEDFYYPIDIHGKSLMQIDNLDRLSSFMKVLRSSEPL